MKGLIAIIVIIVVIILIFALTGKGDEEQTETSPTPTAEVSGNVEGATDELPADTTVDGTEETGTAN